MTQPIQSLQRFQKKYMKITFKKSVLWGRRETELREKKEKKKKNTSPRGHKKLQNCRAMFCFHWPLRTFFHVDSKLLPRCSGFSMTFQAGRTQGPSNLLPLSSYVLLLSSIPRRNSPHICSATCSRLPIHAHHHQRPH